MPKAATFFFIILLSATTTYSYAFTTGDLISVDDVKDLIFHSEILDVDSDFFNENNFKRYLILELIRKKMTSYKIIQCMEYNPITDFFMCLFSQKGQLQI